MAGLVRNPTAVALLLFIILAAGNISAQTCDEPGECVGTVVASVPTTNATACIADCGLVTGCTWITTYEHVGYCKLFLTCDSISVDTCPTCLSSKLPMNRPHYSISNAFILGEVTC